MLKNPYSYECDGKTFECDDDEDAEEMISSDVRKSLSKSEFALPGQRKYPIDTPARVRNAAARLAQQKAAGKINDSDHAEAHAAITAAEKRHGIGSEPKKMTCEVEVQLEGVEIQQLDAKGTTGVWIQIAKMGDFVKDGRSFSFNATTYAEILRNFEAFGQDLPVDYEHASHADAGSPGIATHGAPAQGWIKKLRVDGTKLMALVEWGAQARAQIRAGQYRYFSPVVAFGAKSRTSGELIGACLLSGACTNVPFILQMDRLVAKNTAAKATGQQGNGVGKYAFAAVEYMPQLKEILRLPEIATLGECHDQIARLRTRLASQDAGTETTDGVVLVDYLIPLRDLAGSKPGATWKDVLDHVEGLVNAQIDIETLMTTGASGSSTPTSGGDAEEHDDNMDPKQLETLIAKNGEITAAHAQLTISLTAAEGKVKEADGKIATLTLDLNEAKTAKATVDAELVELRAWKTDRETKDFDARIAEAFGVYKDSKKLTEIDRDSMRVELKHAPETFEKRYPKIPPGNGHLFREVATGNGKREPAAQPASGDGSGATKMNAADLARKIARSRGISVGDAQILVAKMTEQQKSNGG